MDNLTFNSHSLYKNKANGEVICLLHYNPMAVCSCMICGNFNENTFNISGVKLISIDEIISMRKSGDFEELPKLSKELLLQLANAILPAMPESEKQVFEGWKRDL